MRDNNQGMIELLETSRTNHVHSATVRFELNDSFYKVRFGIEIPDYSNLKKILEFRPFENTGIAPYRYFFANSYADSLSEKESINIGVRVEQINIHKQFDFTVTRKFAANLFWFRELESVDPIKDLIISD